jgi:hypothetical protein
MPYDFSRLDQLSDSDLQPVLPEYQAPREPAAGSKDMTAQQAAKQGRPGIERFLVQEAYKGPLGFIRGPYQQFKNVLASPDLYSGRLVADPINAVSKFGNWLGDKVQGRQGDTSDAWLIPDKVGGFAPLRALPYFGDQVTEADKSARGLASSVLPMVVSHVAGYGWGADAVQGLRALGGVRSLAVAAKSSPALARVLNIGSAVGAELAINAAALPFIDPQQGNLANVGDALGLKLPGRVAPTDTYGEALGKTFAVEGLAAPLAAIGALSLIKPFRRTVTEGSQQFWNTTFWETMGDKGLLDQYQYNPNIAVGPQARPTPLLPSGSAPAGAPQLPPGGTREPGGALALPLPETPYGSAIERNLAEATQVKQVQQQRQRLQDAGLLELGPNRQLELSVGAAVNPEIKLQIRQLQTQRGQTIRQANELMAAGDEAGAKALTSELDEIDRAIADLTLSGSSDQFLAPPNRQGELDLTPDDTPDTRPEIDTFLANLDELDDSQLRDIHSQVWRAAGEQRNGEELAAAQQQVQAIEERMTEIVARQAAGDITPAGAKRMTSKAQKELVLAQQQVTAVEMRLKSPEPLVGEQLEAALGPSQLGLNLSQSPELPPLRDITATASEFGYRTADDYRASLQGWNRDQLRRLAMPDSSPEVAALVQARTGRRVWSAKKADIIDALVELSERRGRYLPPEPPRIEQPNLPLKTNAAGVSDAPLLDRPADLSAPGMGKVVDADGNEVSVPMGDYAARGMDPDTRERMRMEILSKAIQNGEVQAPITPIPKRPSAPEFLDQGSFIDDLLADPTGQLPLLYSADAMPIYEAGGKNAAALIDEMRLRFQYVRLDNEAAQAQKEAFMAAHGWDNLSWDDKKKLGILGQGMFAYDRNDLIKYGTDVVRPPTPQFNPELAVTEGPRPPKAPGPAQSDSVTLVNHNGVPTTEAAGAKPKGKASAVEANAQAAANKKAAQAADAADKQAKANAAAARQELLKRRERLAKQANGASC